MVNSMVARATNNMLIGPDWAMNLEICDVCNRDPVQAKDVIKGIKKRLRSKNPKSQLLVLTLLESIMKNCGDIVHMQVADRNLLQDMVKMVKKKPDFHVKEKILILIDTWQEAFGGARGRYPQYYAAYHDLLRLGASFPEKSANLAPVLTPPQTQPITSYPHNPEIENETGARSAEAEFPTLSLTEMQNARGIMDVLAEMLAAVDPAKKEGLRQDVIVDLVEQCRTYKKRLVHLVNSTSDESLLSLGLALNDDLQRVLAKHEALLTSTPQKSNPEKSTPETSRAIVPITPPINATATKQPGSTSGSGAEPDLITLAPVTTNGPSTPKVNPIFDLLSGDDFDSSPASNSLAIVPYGETQPATPVSEQNALAIVPVFSPQTQQPQNMSAQQPSLYPNRNVVQNQPWAGYNQGNNPMWNGHMTQQQQQQLQQQPPVQGFGGSINSGLPLPPWEAPPAYNQFVSGGGGGPQYSQTGLQAPGNNNMNINNHMLPMNNPQNYPQQQMAYMYPQQQMGQQTYSNQTGQQMYGNQTGQQMYGNQMGQQMYGNQMGQQMYGNQMGQQMYGNQMGQQMYGNQPGQPMYGNQPGQQMYSNQTGQQMYGNQMGQVNGNSGYGNGYGNGYGYGQQQNAQLISTSTVYTGPSMVNASYVHKQQKAKDALFGDLVDFKVIPKKT